MFWEYLTKRLDTTRNKIILEIAYVDLVIIKISINNLCANFEKKNEIDLFAIFWVKLKQIKSSIWLLHVIFNCLNKLILQSKIVVLSKKYMMSMK